MNASPASNTDLQPHRIHSTSRPKGWHPVCSLPHLAHKPVPSCASSQAMTRRNVTLGWTPIPNALGRMAQPRKLFRCSHNRRWLLVDIWLVWIRHKRFLVGVGSIATAAIMAGEHFGAHRHGRTRPYRHRVRSGGGQKLKSKKASPVMSRITCRKSTISPDICLWNKVMEI